MSRSRSADWSECAQPSSMTVADLSAHGRRHTRCAITVRHVVARAGTHAGAQSSLLACFYLLLNGHSDADYPRAAEPLFTRNARFARRAVGCTARRCRWEAQPAPACVACRSRGDRTAPCDDLYERQVRAEFLQGPFTGSNESLTFHSAELSGASVRILQRKIERLALDFADLAALDVHVKGRDKSSVAVLLACRPWVFSMFSKFQVKSS